MVFWEALNFNNNHLGYYSTFKNIRKIWVIKVGPVQTKYTNMDIASSVLNGTFP